MRFQHLTNLSFLWHLTHTSIFVSPQLFSMCYLDAYNNLVSEIVYIHTHTQIPPYVHNHTHTHMRTRDIKDVTGQTYSVIPIDIIKNSETLTPIFCFISRNQYLILILYISSCAIPNLLNVARHILYAKFLILTATMQSRCHHPHLTNEETEVQKSSSI